MLHVPYKGSVPAMTDLLGGQIQLIFDAGTSSLPLVRSGKLRVLGVTSAKRASGTPDVPTLAESWRAGVRRLVLVRRRGAGRDAAARRQAPVEGDQRDPQGPGAGRALPPERRRDAGSTPEEMAAQIKSDRPLWAQVQRQAGISPE